MPKKTISTARNYLLRYDTGVNRRLLYLAAGADVGCSLGLFWNICDSFYLVDPGYGTSINLTIIMASLKAGTAGYMPGMKIISDGGTQGTFDGVPGCRFQVWREGNPHVRKRLCFVKSGSKIWLDSTTTHYNVVINKDYAGFEGVDADYPYTRVWSRLNYRGIFCETIAEGRSSETYGFATYQYRGFAPLFEVTRDTGVQLGFGNGFHLFQKGNNGNLAYYEEKRLELSAILGAIKEKLDIFATMIDFGPSAIEGEEGYEELHGLMSHAPKKNWKDFSKTGGFVRWLVAQLPARYSTVSGNLIFDVIGCLRIGTWGGW